MTPRTEPGGATPEDELAESLRDLVGQLVRSVRERTDTQSNAQSEALSHLHRSGPVSVSRLAESRGVTHQTMRLVVARLEASGLVERKSDPADGRGQLVELTAQGREAALDGQRKRAAWLAQAIRTTLSPAEQDALAEALSLLKRVIAASGTPPPT